MSKEQVYFELLARTDHPVYEKDFSHSTDISSPLNSIFNRIFARQLCRLKKLVDEVQKNLYPHLVTALTIDDWEMEYFGFSKSSLPLEQRKVELLIKYNRRFSMGIQDVIALSEAIVGAKPSVTRNVSRAGWVLGRSSLGISTTLSNPASAGGQGLYLVNFHKPTDSGLLAKLDQRLTLIEKAGSRHRVKAPNQRWILGRTPLGRGTTLGAN